MSLLKQLLKILPFCCATTPRFILEATAFGGIMTLIFQMKMTGSFNMPYCLSVYMYLLDID